MNKEEILARSQQENRGMDIANIEVSKASIQIGWIVVVCLLGVVTVVDALVFSRANYEVFFAVMSGLSAVFFSKYMKLRKRHELVIAAVYAFAAVMFLIGWILQLVQ